MRRKSIVSICLAAAVLVGGILGGSFLKGQVKTPPAVPQVRSPKGGTDYVVVKVPAAAVDKK